MYICGKRGGESYYNATKPDKTGACPPYYRPCSRETSGINTICYEKSETDTNCPITDIQFVPSDSYDENGEYAGYDRISMGKFELLYTKTLADKLPIAATSVGYKPCLNKTHISRGEDYAELFYKENDYDREKCKKYDERFEQIGFTTSEYDV